MSAKGQMTENAGAGRMLRPVAVSVGIGAIVCIAFLVLFAVIISSRDIPQSAIDPMAIFAVSVGSFVAGLCCARVVRNNGLMCGLVCGVILSVIVMLCGLAVPDNGLGLGALIKVMIMLFSGMLGGVLGVNTKRRKK